jgi:hypothetical protein
MGKEPTKQNRFRWICCTMDERVVYVLYCCCLAFRIHTSESTASLLEQIGGFHLEYRGMTEIKVKPHNMSVNMRK